MVRGHVLRGNGRCHSGLQVNQSRVALDASRVASDVAFLHRSLKGARFQFLAFTARITRCGLLCVGVFSSWEACCHWRCSRKNTPMEEAGLHRASRT